VNMSSRYLLFLLLCGQGQALRWCASCWWDGPFGEKEKPILPLDAFYSTLS